jgi:hypothetical protein
MAQFRIRDFHPDDIDGILHLWEEMRVSEAEPVYGLSDVIASCQQDYAGQLLAALEKRMTPLGLSKLSVLLPDTGVRVDAFGEQGYKAKKNLFQFRLRRMTSRRDPMTTLISPTGALTPTLTINGESVAGNNSSDLLIARTAHRSQA